jgi:phage terminase large subunit GpA-like protein
MTHTDQLLDILHSSRVQLSDMKPSDWAEMHRVLSPEVTGRPGPFRYDYAPYTREIVDCLSPYHPAKIIGVRKGAQITFSTGVIESGIGWIISQNPGNILFLTGSPDLTEVAMNKKIDQMIDGSGLRHLIHASTQKAKNQRTGDTKKGKEFPGGSLIAGNASNHKLLRQISVRYGFIDDFDSIKRSSEQSGSTRKLIMKRFAAYRDLMKVFFISTPELKSTSNIDEVFDLGDQRYWHVPCPCCGEQIPLQWSIQVDGSKELAGLTWKEDNHGKLIDDSVGYICQKCASFFDETNKHEMNLAGEWVPTAEPSEIGFYSYQISALYAPSGHFNWNDQIREYKEANPPSGRKEADWKVFVNTVLGESYEHKGATPDAGQVQSKIRNYKIGGIPEWQSEKDGNGKMIMLTCACDLNGVEEDARLDYEIIAWSETGSSYSILHGSIGTFVYREGEKKEKIDRKRWNYVHGTMNSVWPELTKLLNSEFETDTDRIMKIVVAGIDCGHYTKHAYAYIDGVKIKDLTILGIKGDKEENYRKYKQDTALFKLSHERSNLYLLDVNYIKDLVAEYMKLEWESRTGDPQPPGYMNYPEPEGGLYGYENFFKHYEAEHRTDDIKKGVIVGTKWVKKNTNVQNHYWDVYIYNYALKDLWAFLVLKEMKKKGTWRDFVNYILGKD